MIHSKNKSSIYISDWKDIKESKNLKPASIFVFFCIQIYFNRNALKNYWKVNTLCLFQTNVPKLLYKEDGGNVMQASKIRSRR